MSGIVGVFTRDGRTVDQIQIQQMVASIAHRGPDRSRDWIHHSVGLGHCMLMTTNESLCEHLPLTKHVPSLTITCDARIDNRDELIDLIGYEGRPALEIPDSELILDSYRIWGQDCLQRLVGDFSFALWDHENSLLFCARDPIGVKPFYYFCSNQLFAFASEIKALFVGALVPREKNEGRIADYLVEQLEGIDHTSTFYKGVLRLAPGHSLTVNRKTDTQHQYWRPPVNQEIRLGSSREYEDVFRDLFIQAVQCRLRSSSAQASTLSGGVDSSSIIAVAHNIFKPGPEKLHTISALSHEDSDPENHFIRTMMSRNGIESLEVYVSKVGMLLEDLNLALDNSEDLFDSNMTLMEVIYIAAARNGLRVVLDGVDGDVAASLDRNYPVYLFREGRWRDAIREASALRRLHADPVSPTRIFYQTFRSAFAPDWARTMLKQFRKKARFKEAVAKSIINPEFAKRIDLTARLDELQRHKPAALFADLRRAHANDIIHPYISSAMERYDRVASAFGIEPRHPFFDIRLLAFTVNLPWDQKAENGMTKLILRRSMSGLLPDEVRLRFESNHLGPKFTEARLRLMMPQVDEIISTHIKQIAEYVNIAALTSSYERYKKNGSIEEAHIVWRAFTLFLWLKRNHFL